MASLEYGIETIKKYAKTAPMGPGVYRMLNKSGDALYVGKAINIAARIKAYTQPKRLPNRLQRMVSETVTMEFVTTRTEAGALLLEAALIKRLKPHYNVLLKDDKSFPYILLRHSHPWPQIAKHRGGRKHKGLYFGPFASVGSVNRTLNTLQKVFQLRTCTDATLEARSRPCLLYQIKRCSGPCADKVSEQEYRDMVNETRAFLEGRTTEIQQKFSTAMKEASANQQYELAAIFRDRLKALTQIQSQQTLTNAMTAEADIIAAAKVGGKVGVQVFFFRAGQNWGHRAYFPQHDPLDDVTDVLESFITQFYENKPAPKLVLTSHSLPSADLVSQALSEKMERRVDIHCPQRGAKAETVKQAVRNAVEAVERRLAESASQLRLLEGMAEEFMLDTPPKRIEVYDNSHIQGTSAVGAMIVSGPDGFMKNQYRKFNIKDSSRTPGDDFAMMCEVLTRRFKRLAKEDPDREKGHWPDLLLIDGGKGQLSSAMSVMTELGIDNIEIIAISKGQDRNAGREEFHFTDGTRRTLPLNHPVLYFCQRLRDEAHRFAIGTHRSRRGNSMRQSSLDSVPGIGPKRKKALLHHFGSAKAVTDADIKALTNVEGISKEIAERIYAHFHSV